MAHNQIDRQAKGILSRRNFTKKPRSGQEDPPLREFPNYSVAPTPKPQSCTRQSIFPNCRRNKIPFTRPNTTYLPESDTNGTYVSINLKKATKRKNFGAAARRGNPYGETHRRCTTQKNFNQHLTELTYNSFKQFHLFVFNVFLIFNVFQLQRYRPRNSYILLIL